MDDKTRRALLNRVRRVRGQLSGIERMIEDDRYCVDVLVQIAAVRAAALQLGKALLASHVDTCVAPAIASGTVPDRRQKLRELVELFAKFGAS